jgi:N-acetylglucosaminyldiphosphoundecaprenol N-acetyl-beta-D-mannosaminyltransferase
MKKQLKKSTESGSIIDKKAVIYHQMYGLSFFGSNIARLLRVLGARKEEKGLKTWLITVNPEFIMKTISDKNFLDVINKSDIRTIDGIGIIWAQKVLIKSNGLERWFLALKEGLKILSGKSRESLISGSDLMVEFCKKAAQKNEKIFFLGGYDDRAKKCGDYFSKKFRGLKYDFSSGEPTVKNDEVIKKINAFRPDYLLVAYGMKKQEEWIEKNLKKLDVKVVMGVGRSFDYYSGALKRAPMWIRKMGLEWLFSLIKEPRRWRRQLVLPKFIWMVMTQNHQEK